MKHPRPNKPHPELPFLMSEAEGEQSSDEAWDAALGEPVDLNSLAEPASSAHAPASASASASSSASAASVRPAPGAASSASAAAETGSARAAAATFSAAASSANASSAGSSTAAASSSAPAAPSPAAQASARRRRTDALAAGVDLNELAAEPRAFAARGGASTASDPGGSRGAGQDPVRLRPADKPPFDAGEFRLVARLAVGGMSEVWLADALQGELAGRTVVVKRLLPSLRADAGSVERFRAEALLGAALQHENLAQTFGLHTRGLEMFLVQELLGGETLALLAAASRKHGERLSIASILHAADGVLGALAFLHGEANAASDAAVRVVHGDVNPDNVVCQFDGGVKLIDLGLAQTLRPDGTVASPDGALRGTPAYMSPEQVKSRPLSARSDLFSAGVMLWELFANRPLFAAESEFETLRRVRELAAPPLRAVWPEAPTALERILVRALAKEPQQRFATAHEFRDSLRQLAQRMGRGDGRAALAAEVLRHAPKGPKVE